MAARSAASCGEMSDEGGADDSTATGDVLGEAVGDGSLELAWSELGSITDGLTVTDTTAVEVGPLAEPAVQPTVRTSTPTARAAGAPDAHTKVHDEIPSGRCHLLCSLNSKHEADGRFSTVAKTRRDRGRLIFVTVVDRRAACETLG